MMVMTAKVDKKKMILALAAVAALVLALILLLGDGKPDTAQTGAPAASNNDQRVKFLTDLGWQVTTSPKESSQVKIPSASSEVFDRYNALQKSQGYDLGSFAGKKVMRYVYQINNFPGATEPVYATLLIYKNEIIGGDVTDTAAGGRIQGFKPVQQPAASAPTESTAPAVGESTPAPSVTAPVTQETGDALNPQA